MENSRQTRSSRPSGAVEAPSWAAQVGLSQAVDAQPFEPSQQTPIAEANKGSHVKPLKVRSVFDNLDSVPFTPSQGICTPSPTNVATMWVSNPFYHEMAFHQPMSCVQGQWGPPISPMITHLSAESGNSASDTSSVFNQSDMTSLPTSPFAGLPPGAPYVVPVYFPMPPPNPYSPGAVVHMDPQFSRPSTSPGTPKHGRSSDGGGGTAHGNGTAVGGGGTPKHSSPSRCDEDEVLAGPEACVNTDSPPVVAYTPGRAIFAQYLAQEGYSTNRGYALDFAAAQNATSPSPVREAPRGRHGAGTGGKLAPVPPGAREAARVISRAHDVHGEPPTALVELASLLVMFGIPPESAFVPVPTTAGGGGGGGGGGRSSAAGSPVKGGSGLSSQNGDGARLNARQRRTLRRAQERAMAAIQIDLHGDPADTAAAQDVELPRHHDSYNSYSNESTPMSISPGGGARQFYPQHAQQQQFSPDGGPLFSNSCAPSTVSMPMARWGSGELVAVQYPYPYPYLPATTTHGSVPLSPNAPMIFHGISPVPPQFHPQHAQQQQFGPGVAPPPPWLPADGGGPTQQPTYHGGANSRAKERGAGRRRLSRFAPHHTVSVR